MLIKDILLSVRYRIDDMERTTSDFSLMEYYNDGNRLLRRIILDYYPAILTEIITGTTTGIITLPKKPIKIIEMRIDNHRINPVNVTTIQDKTVQGKPSHYYTTSLTTYKLYPVPVESMAYEITYIPEATIKEDTDESSYQAEVDDMLIEYVAARVRGSANDVVANWNEQIIKLLGNIEPEETQIQGYW